MASSTSNRPPLASWEHLIATISNDDDRYSSLHEYLRTCVRPGERVIIFRSHGPKAIKVALTLRALGHNAAPIAGKMSESERSKTLQCFVDGSIPILVCTEVAIMDGIPRSTATVPFAEHIINYGFHYSSADGNTKTYISRAHKGNGRILTLVTIADSVTVTYLKQEMGFPLRRVNFFDDDDGDDDRGDHHNKNTALKSDKDSFSAVAADPNDLTKLQIKARVANLTSKEYLRTVEQDKLSSFLSNIPTPLKNSSSIKRPSQQHHHQDLHAIQSVSPQDAMKNISDVMKRYQSLGSTNDDDESFQISDEDDSDDDDESDNDDSNIKNKNKSKALQQQQQHTIKKVKNISLGQNNNNTDGMNVSPTRSRRPGYHYPQQNNDHHGHVQLPNYGNKQNNNNCNNNNNNNRGSPIGERTFASSNRQRSVSRGGKKNKKYDSDLCVPRQVDKMTGQYKLDQGPFQARPGDEALVEMIEHEMKIGNVTTTFDDIAGQEEAKQLLQESVVLPTLMPNFFTGVRAPSKGLLLYGPPGTGKTLLAKAVAASARTTFFAVSPATLTSKWRGESEKLIRVLFEMARHYAPSTIFIDECDSLASKRGGSTEHEASRRAKSMLLQEMDGMQSDPSKVVMVLGATNHPWDIDDAMRRRFEQRIYIPLPTQSDRQSLFKLNIKNIIVGSDVKIPEISSLLEGKFYSGADITLLIRDAALRPMRRYLYGDKDSSSVDPDDDENKSSSSSAAAAAEQRRKEVFANPQMYEEKLSQLPVTMNDFKMALKNVPSSVNKDQIKRFEEWRAEFSS